MNTYTCTHTDLVFWIFHSSVHSLFNQVWIPPGQTGRWGGWWNKNKDFYIQNYNSSPHLTWGILSSFLWIIPWNNPSAYSVFSGTLFLIQDFNTDTQVLFLHPSPDSSRIVCANINLTQPLKTAGNFFFCNFFFFLSVIKPCKEQIP